MKQISCLLMILFFVTIFSYKAYPDEKVFTDQDLKKYDYEHQTPDRKPRSTSNPQGYEYRDPQSPYNRTNNNNLGSYQDEEKRQELKQRIDDENMRMRMIKEEQMQQTQMNFQKAAEEAKVRVGAFVLVFIILPSIAWLIALIDVLKNEFTGSNKVIWFLTVTFIPIIGPILYYFMGFKHQIEPYELDRTDQH